MYTRAVLLLYISRFFAVCALLAGQGAGVLVMLFGTGFICFDSCPTRAFYFSRLVPGTLLLMTPCIACECLALLAYLCYCSARRRPRHVVAPVAVLLVGGALGATLLGALILHGQANLPVNADGLLIETPAEAWAQLWGFSVLIVASLWSVAVGYVLWRP